MVWLLCCDRVGSLDGVKPCYLLYKNVMTGNLFSSHPTISLQTNVTYVSEAEIDLFLRQDCGECFIYIHSFKNKILE